MIAGLGHPAVNWGSSLQKVDGDLVVKPGPRKLSTSSTSRGNSSKSHTWVLTCRRSGVSSAAVNLFPMWCTHLPDGETT